jgi:predicted CXXCH cytochrome family protein
MMSAISRNNLRFPVRVRLFLIVLVLLAPCLFFFFPHPLAEAESNIINTKHDLSVNSTSGGMKSTSENRICVFCHTPHDAYRLSPANGGTGGSGPVAPDEYTYLPLWNHEVTTTPETGYYTSSTMKAPVPQQPTGPTKLCLSCHDGTVALGAVASGANLGIAQTMNDAYSVGTVDNPTPNLGTDLSTHHPVSFSYSSSLPNSELYTIDELPDVIRDRLSGNNEVHCTTCHDPHDDSNGNFLVIKNSLSALCTTCHQMANWAASGHATATNSVTGKEACEICHTPHFAVDVPLLIYNTSDSATFCTNGSCHGTVPSPLPPPTHGDAAIVRPSAVVASCMPSCHSAEPFGQSLSEPDRRETIAFNTPLRPFPAMPSSAAGADIRSQIQKISSHHERPGIARGLLRNLSGQARALIGGVACVDCHNPHVSNRTEARAPFASGMLEGVSGVDRNGMDVSSVTYQYEVCFKCHADYSADVQYVPRVIPSTNMRLAFDGANPSYHPVEEIGRSLAVPSIPSPLNPALNAQDMIYCTDCHSDDAEGSKGPHGSSFPPILKERYETADGTPESSDNYALCYRCHNRSSILSDVSFRKKINGATASGGGHSGHLGDGAPCSACHDPHGVNVSLSGVFAQTGAHTHLINFDTRIVLPKPGNPYPIYTDTGNFSGSCTLVCHGKLHDNLSYP